MNALVVCLALAAPAAAFADATTASPVGRWTTIDDSTHKPKSIVRLWDKDGVIFGNIETVFPEPGKPADPICDKCDGVLKNKPVKGMLFLWNMKKDDDEWTGGRIVDPGNGKVYRCTISLADKGMKLKVRGFVGVSLFGRTQYWLRVVESGAPTN
jgi:uncharacterized protein (DUF2147 family)